MTTERLDRLVDKVCDKRRRLVSNKIKSSHGKFAWPAKMLVFELDETVSDGGAEAASKGFYDVESTPGWDTWIDFGVNADSTRQLLCYVPTSRLEDAKAGVDVEPVMCIVLVDPGETAGFAETAEEPRA